MASHTLSFDMAPFRLSGDVYCALLNHAPLLASLGDTVNQPPYKTPPKEPVLAVRPRNTQGSDGDDIEVPKAMPALEMGACLGIVIGHCACRVPLASAMDFVAGYIVMNDVSAPLPSHYRPALRFKARDGFCAMGTVVTPAADVPDPDALGVRVFVDGKLAQISSTADRIRNVARLIADVSDFMTLQPGDILMLGVAADSPVAQAGQSVRVEIDNLGTVTSHLIAEEVSS